MTECRRTLRLRGAPWSYAHSGCPSPCSSPLPQLFDIDTVQSLCELHERRPVREVVHSRKTVEHVLAVSDDGAGLAIRKSVAELHMPAAAPVRTVWGVGEGYAPLGAA